jgi:hypothetical protein
LILAIVAFVVHQPRPKCHSRHCRRVAKSPVEGEFLSSRILVEEEFLSSQTRRKTEQKGGRASGLPLRRKSATDFLVPPIHGVKWAPASRYHSSTHPPLCPPSSGLTSRSWGVQIGTARQGSHLEADYRFNEDRNPIPHYTHSNPWLSRVVGKLRARLHTARLKPGVNTHLLSSAPNFR